MNISPLLLKRLFLVICIIVFNPTVTLLLRKYYMFNIPLIIYTVLILIHIIVFLSGMVFVVVYFLKNIKKDFHTAILLILIQFISVIFFMVFGTNVFTGNDEQRFEDNYEQLNKIVLMVQSGELKPNQAISPIYNDSSIKLPLKLRYLSIDGEVGYEKIGDNIKLFFATSTDILNEYYYGYIYNSSGKEKEHYKKVQECWFITSP